MTDPRINEIQARVDAALSYDLEAPIQFDDTESYAYNCGAAVLADDAAFLLARLAEPATKEQEEDLAKTLEVELEWWDSQDWSGLSPSEVRGIKARHLAMHVRDANWSPALSASPEPEEGK